MSYKIDVDILCNKLNFDKEDVAMLLDVFVECSQESLYKLSNAIRLNDFNLIYKASHAIKGSASNLLLEEIALLAKEIEYNAKNSADFDYVQKSKELEELIISLSYK